jgi:hypothetical protein
MKPNTPVIPPTIRLRAVFELYKDLRDTPRDSSKITNSIPAIEYLTNPIVKGGAIVVRILIATQAAPQRNIEKTSAA